MDGSWENGDVEDDELFGKTSVQALEPKLDMLNCQPQAANKNTSKTPVDRLDTCPRSGGFGPRSSRHSSSVVRLPRWVFPTGSAELWDPPVCWSDFLASDRCRVQR